MRVNKLFSTFLKKIFLSFYGHDRKVMIMKRGLFKGIKLNIFPKHNLHLIYRNIEPDLQKILEKFLSKGDTVFDVGANIGYVSIAMSKLIGKHGKVISFEPIEETSSSFLENIRINESDNITLVSKALSDKVETVTFRIPDSKSNHSVASMMWHKSNKNTIDCKLQTYVLDDMHEHKDLSPSFIKIDVEGAEGKVILGMKNLISRCRPIIYIECSKAGRQTTWDIFKELNYSCFFCFNLDKEVVNFSEYRHNDFVWIPN